jgi:CubicO group peptidase (beta-lactamase class C family)
MKGLKKLFFALVFIIALISALAVFTGNSHLFKAVSTTYLVGKTGPSIWDYKFFEHRELPPGPKTFFWVSGEPKSLPEAQLQKIEKYNPAAFLVIQNGKILYENYWGEGSQSSATNSFSMAKSFTALAIGSALNQGLIKSVNDKVSDYLPRFNYPEAENLTIYHLLTMSSNINFDESYGNPLGYMAKVYYGNDIRKLSLPYKVVEEPGTSWEYLGGNTLLLAEIVEKVSGQNLSDFFNQNIWAYLGTEQSAFWTIDKKGIEKAYCCFYSNARDYAKLGQLLINQGSWNGAQILDSSFVAQAISSTRLNNGEIEEKYGYQIWLTEYEGHFVPFYRGILGQYVFTIPSLDVIIVRLGEGRSNEKEKGHPKDVFEYLEAAFEIIER